MAVKAMLGRVGSNIEQLRLVCTDLHWGEIGIPANESPVGNMSLSAVHISQELCSNRGVMTGLYGRGTDRIRRIGGMCEKVKRIPASMVAPLIRNGGEHVFPANGDDKGAELEAECDPGTALVGIGGGTAPTGDLSHLVGYCADVTDWDDPQGYHTVQALPSIGGTGTLDTQVLCSTGEFMVGLRTRASAATDLKLSVERVTPICRSFRNTGTLGLALKY